MIEFWFQKSFEIQFPCRDAGDTQPNHFKKVEQFVEFIRAHPKKGVQMSQYTVDELYNLSDDYTKHDVPTGDPVDSYVTRYAYRLGFRRDNSDGESSSVLCNYVSIYCRVPPL